MQKSDYQYLARLGQDREVNERLEFYANKRIAALKDSLVSAQDMEQVRKLQGQIQEAQRLLTLRDEIKAAVSKNG